MGAGVIGAIIGLFCGGPIGAIIRFFIGLACEKSGKKQKEKTNSLASSTYSSSLPTLHTASSKKQEKTSNEDKYQTLLDCVSDWSEHEQQSIKHRWFVPYYPYRKYKSSATSDMWADWKFIWNFKNDEGTPSQAHTAALQRAIRLTESALRQTFHQKVSNLTLVCLPASSASKNQRRFAAFSRTVCQDLGMQDGFGHIRITADATPKHKGGTGEPKKWYDSSFFWGKYVIIFDDVSTSGKSLVKEKAKLESLGAKVIGAITLAQTQS